MDLSVKKVSTIVTSTGAKAASATAGLAVGAILASKIPVPQFGPDWLKEHLQKALPGLSVLAAAYIASQYKSKHVLVEPAAIGMGIAGFGALAKSYFPDLASKFIPLQGPYVPPGEPDFIGMGDLTEKLQYQLGEGESGYMDSMKLTA